MKFYKILFRDDLFCRTEIPQRRGLGAKIPLSRRKIPRALKFKPKKAIIALGCGVRSLRKERKVRAAIRQGCV